MYILLQLKKIKFILENSGFKKKSMYPKDKYEMKTILQMG